MGMKPIWTAATVAMVALARIATADAQSPKDAQSQRLLAEMVAIASATCGSAITMELADPARAIEPAQRDNAVRGCREAFEGIHSVCKTQAGRAAVRSQVKHVSCGTSGEFAATRGLPAVALDGGLLEYRYQIEPDVAPTERRWEYERYRVYDYLINHLRVEGQPLFVQVLRPREEESLTNHVAQTNRSCGTSLTVTFDWTGVSAPAIKDGYPSNYCGHALDMVERVCVDRAGREAVAKKIKRIICGYAVERSISLEDGELVFKSDFQASEDRRTFIFEYLQNAL